MTVTAVDLACTPVLPAAGAVGSSPAPEGSTSFGDLVAAALAGEAPGAGNEHDHADETGDTGNPGNPGNTGNTGDLAAGAPGVPTAVLLLGLPAGAPILPQPVAAPVTSGEGATDSVGAGGAPVQSAASDSPTAPTTPDPASPASALSPTTAELSRTDGSVSDASATTSPTADLPPPAATPPTATPGAPTAVAGPTGTVPAGTHAGTHADAPAGTAAAQVIPEIATLTSRGEGVHRVTLQLNPRALGDVRVVLTMRQGDVHVRLAAGTEARAALAHSSVELSRALDQLGLGGHRILLTDPRGDAAVVVARGTTQDAGQPTDSHDPTPGRPDTTPSGGFEARDQQQDHHSRTGAEQFAMDGVIPHRSTDPRRGSGQNSSIDLRAQPGGVDLRM